MPESAANHVHVINVSAGIFLMRNSWKDEGLNVFP
jgi:hypothetical protein